MKTGIFLDLDGTLLNDDYQISDFDKKVIRELKDKYSIYLITGKSLSGSIKYYNELNLNTYLITSMGQVISKGDIDNIVYLDAFHPKEFNGVYDYLKSKINVLSYGLEGYKKLFYLSSDDLDENMMDIIDHENKVLAGSIDELKKIISVNFEVDSFNEEEVLEIKKNLNQHFDGLYHFTYWKILNKPFVIHGIKASAGKWKSICKVKKWDNLDQIIAIGNGHNDIEMIKKSNIGVAMNNANKEIKDSANIITKENNNNSGVGKTLLNVVNKYY